MLRTLIARRLAVEERRAGVPLDYARFVLRTSLTAFIKYALFQPIARHRQRLPADEYYAACLVTTQSEDCGSCVQIVVNLARKAGVSADLLQRVLRGRWEELPEPVADACAFARSVLAGEDSPAVDALRERVRRRHGDRGLVDLAFAIATSRVFPTTKRALGYAVSCSRVTVDI